MGNDLAAARALLEVNQVDRARELATRHLADAPDAVDALCILALCADAAGDTRGMLAAAERAVAADPAEESAWRLLASAQQQRRRPHAAVRSAWQAVKLAPSSWLAHVAFTLAVLNLPPTPDNTRRAYRAARRAVRAVPQEAGAHALLGFVYARAGADGPARRCYLEALRRDPTETTALNGLTVIELRRGATGRAANRIREAVQFGPLDPVLLHNLAHVARTVTLELTDLGSAALLVAIVVALVGPAAGQQALIASLAVAVGGTLAALRVWRLPTVLRRQVATRRWRMAFAAGPYLAALAVGWRALVPAVVFETVPLLVVGVAAIVVTVARLYLVFGAGTVRRVRGWWYVRTVLTPPD